MQPSSPAFSPDRVGKPVVLVTHEYAPFQGGVATYVREVATAAARMGNNVAVWTVDYEGRGGPVGLGMKVDNTESSAKFPVVRLRSNGRLTPGGLLRFAWGIWRRRAELRGVPVVLSSVGAQMVFFLLDAIGLRPGGPVTCIVYGSEVPRFRRNPFWRWLARRFYRRTHAFATITGYVATLWRESGLLPEGATIELVPCALPAMFHVEQITEVPAPRESDAYLRVLTVARLHPRKGQLEVVQALGLLSEELRTRIVYQLVGVGSEAYRQQVEAACRASGVRCEFLGAVADGKLGEIYARATVYAQASQTLAQSVEGFGITFLEASAYGVPIAAWRTGGVAEAVADGETGLLVDEGDLAGLATALEGLLRDPALRQKLGRTGREFAGKFSWQASARALCRLATDRY